MTIFRGALKEVPAKEANGDQGVRVVDRANLVLVITATTMGP